MKTGDAIHAFAQPFAKGVDAVLGTNVAGCAGCGKMRQNLNAGMSVTDAIYERWFKAKQQGEKMKYQLTVIVDSEKMSDAVLKAETVGEVISTQVKPVPQSRPAPTVVPGMPAGMQRVG